MANGKIGCNKGKTYLVDPNNFGGNSSNNIFVPLEDLNISVQLKTTKRGRTILSANNSVRTAESTKTLKVSFIEGSDINGKKVLTSKFTDLTTVFDNNESENLGITNIDIDFNSQQTPMITINFVDVRGSAIFQNEDKILSTENKYSIFFQLPYPLYELTIKGYYGQAVTYCLHMLKFNSKFNPTTGNFEITAQFIGSTYAMLSDMLIGFLKAVPYTEIGSKIYKDINDKRGNLPPIPNLNELMVSISNVNENIEKISKDELSASVIGSSNSKHDNIEVIKNEIEGLWNDISFDKTIRTDNNEYKYIFVNNTINVDGFITGYNDNVTKQVVAFNNNNDVVLSKEIVTSVNKHIAIGVTAKELDLSQTLDDNELGDFAKKFNVLKNEALEKREDVVRNLFGKKISGIINVYDLTSIYTELNKTVSNFEANIDNEKRNLAETIRQNVSGAIGFEPTVRNIIEVFTVAVEVFLTTIFTVSNNAKNNISRTNELKIKFNNTQNTNNNNNDYNLLSSDFHPWPEYREKEDKQGYVEKYLGTAGILNNPFNVNELEFIDDLLNAFLTAALYSKNGENELTNITKSWTPINPLDTPLFTETFPYDRLQDGGLTREDVINLMVIRGMTFLGYTNMLNGVSDTDILLMAESDANGALNHITNDKVKTSFNTIGLNDFITATGTLDGKRVNLLNQNNDKGKLFYSYNYIYPSIEKKVLPIKGNFNISNEKPVTNTDLVLTNYSNNVKISKPVDGAIYLKIMPINEYYGNDIEFETSIDSEIKPIIYNELNKSNVLVEKSGLSAFGGKYGIQEFRDMDYGEKNIKDLPLMYVFYDSFLYQGLGKNRANSKLKTTKFDLRENGKYKTGKSISTFQTRKSIFSFIDNENWMVHDDYGKTMQLFTFILKNKFYISYPFINYKVRAGTISNDDLFSLFGSPWYYGQKTSKYKNYNQALLFLNTFPWRSNSFEHPVIYNLFSIKGGFIHAPKLWCAYIGSILWRYDTSEPTMVDGVITKGGSGKEDPIIWKYNHNGTESFFDSVIYKITERDEYMTMLNAGSVFNDNKISDILLGLSDQMKDEFKKAFFEFVNGEYIISWSNLRDNLEIWDGDGVSFKTEINTIKSTIDKGKISVDSLKNLKNKDNYEVITTNFDSLFLELKGDYETSPIVGKSNINQDIIKAMMEEIIIVNTGYAIWGGKQAVKSITTTTSSPTTLATTQVTVHLPIEDNGFEIINTPEDKFRLYFNKVVEVFSANTTSVTTIKKENEIALFGTSNENLIKLQLYRHCKNVYDKWVGGTDNINNIVFRCNGSDDKPLRNSLDSEIAIKYGGSNNAKLIDSFRFVTRSFKDVGDKLFINPTPVNSFLRDNPNSNVYHAITELLANNNFTFTPLPTFINYKDISVLESIFEPHTYTNAIENGVCGPSFVCVYIGQSSKNLDMGVKNSDYSSDGFDIRCDNNGNMSILPDDFGENAEPHEDVVPVFAVNFGQQNQNIFKDVNLDQSEFGETAESLLIVDEITKQGGENNRTLAGQNIYNVYSVRSYKSEIEMMGNAMIQPMMYYQLNNIPMFHGAYMITRVKHNIKPNYMSTNFTGVRIRLPETKIFDASDLYMSLIDSFNLSSSSTSVLPRTPHSNNSSPNSRLAKKGIKCGTVTKTVISFEKTLNLVVTHLEGAYCKGGSSCGSNNSGETLWGLDRKNHAVTTSTIGFWKNVDGKDKSRWNSVYPAPSDEPTLFKEYSNIILVDYERFKKLYLKNSTLVNLIESDGRLYFNMVYAVFNGPGFFRGFAKLLNEAYVSGKQTSDELVKIFIDERVYGGYNAYNLGTGKNLGNNSAKLIADTGYDIEKLSGLGNFCVKT